MTESDPDLPAPAEPGHEAAAPPAKVMERPHPLTPVVRSWIALVALTVFLGREYIQGLGSREPLSVSDDWEFLAVIVGSVLLLLVLYGYLSWRTTRFVIDDDEVRIEHRLISHRSDKIGYQKIQGVDLVQPFAARLLGLASLRINAGSGQSHEIAFLSRARASQLRDLLLARAHSSRTPASDLASQPLPSVLDDLSADDRVIVRVPPRMLVWVAVTSSEFMLTLVFVLLATVLPLILIGHPARLFLVIPMVLSLVGVVTNRVIKQWRFTLADTGQGVRVTRGMTTLESHSLPVNRIQQIEIEQSLLARPLGLYRVTMHVLGGQSDEVTGDKTLMPAGDWAMVQAAIAAVWPGFDPDEVALHPVPRRARVLHPIGWRGMKWGYDDKRIVARRGVIGLNLIIAPHARAESVALAQGPLQRRLRLATVQVHTSGSAGSILHLFAMDEAIARNVVFTELDRATQARAQEARQRAELVAATAPTVTPGSDAAVAQ